MATSGGRLQRGKITRFRSGFSGFFTGLSFISENKLWKYILVPAVLSVALATGIFWSVTLVLIELVVKILSQGEGFWWSLLRGVSYFVSVAIALVATFLLYRSLAAIIVIPFLGPLLSRVEKIVRGYSIEVSLGKDIMNAIVGVWVGLKFLFLEIILLALSLLTGPAQPFLMAFVEGYFLGRGSFEYLLEKNSGTLKERKELAKQFLPEMFGLGLANFIFLLIPLAGAMLAPAAAITGAALIYLED